MSSKGFVTLIVFLNNQMLKVLHKIYSLTKLLCDFSIGIAKNKYKWKLLISKIVYKIFFYCVVLEKSPFYDIGFNTVYIEVDHHLLYAEYLYR